MDRIGQSSPCELIKFPDRTTHVGKIIDSYLRRGVELSDQSVHLMFSANRWDKAKWIEDTLDKGVNIVCDRYAYSGITYSMSKVRKNE